MCVLPASVRRFFYAGVKHMKLKARLMDEAAMNRALMRISHEITEKNKGVDNIVLVGIRRRGVPISERIRDNIKKIEDVTVPCGSVDIRFYRDDLSHESEQPVINKADIGADVNELAPMLDQSGVSTATACKVLRELLLALEK